MSLTGKSLKTDCQEYGITTIRLAQMVAYSELVYIGPLMPPSLRTRQK